MKSIRYKHFCRVACDALLDAWLSVRLLEELCGRRRRHTLKAVFYHVAGEGCVGVDAQLLLVSTTSDVQQAVWKLLLDLFSVVSQQLLRCWG
jgi:hypothetical protein